MLEKYLSVRKIDLHDSRPLFREVKKGETLRASGGLTYSRLRELLRQKLSLLADKFSVHSLHTGVQPQLPMQGYQTNATADGGQRWLRMVTLKIHW